MFKRILIANRGEIAVRVIRACHDLGLKAIAVYSEADADSLHVKLADEAVCIGPAPASESYLKPAAILSAAEIASADAIHPGFGFLSENAHFAKICAECGFAFVGPSPEVIATMGDKSAARDMMRAAGVPVTPGSDGTVADAAAARAVASRLGYPVLVKAVAGGGGKGMRTASSDAELDLAFRTASEEARRAFGNPDCYVEKLVTRARHIEVQLVADRHGHVYAPGERDCSLQRRHQKMLEETPSPALTPARRKKLLAAAVRAAEACHLDSLSTIEFLWDEDSQEFYFMEMNTRIQVEHPITEETAGVDLVQAQLLAAAGEPLEPRDWDVTPSGHAIEVRVNAENPYQNFTPSPGTVTALHFPGGPGIRVDSHLYAGYTVPPNYDSMLAKIIARGPTRDVAIARLRRALSEFELTGLHTTVPVAQALLWDTRFLKGDYDTRFLERFMSEVFQLP
jgi:acetyl-CoA carboxylase biotin carboxylase subunit